MEQVFTCFHSHSHSRGTLVSTSCMSFQCTGVYNYAHLHKPFTRPSPSCTRYSTSIRVDPSAMPLVQCQWVRRSASTSMMARMGKVGMAGSDPGPGAAVLWFWLLLKKKVPPMFKNSDHGHLEWPSVFNILHRSVYFRM